MDVRDIIIDVRPAGNERDALLSIFWVDAWVVKDLALLAWYPKKSFSYAFLAENLYEHTGIHAIMSLQMDWTPSGKYINVLDPPLPEYVEFESLTVTWISSAIGDVQVDLLNPDGSVRAGIQDPVAVAVAFREQSVTWTIPGARVSSYHPANR
eukprot:tig00000455_g1058.t1